jgi:hypothetical protein
MDLNKVMLVEISLSIRTAIMKAVELITTAGIEHQTGLSISVRSGLPSVVL